MSSPATGSSGIALKATGITLLVAGALLYAALGGVDESPLVIVGPLVMIGGLVLVFRGRQHAARIRALGAASPLSDAKPDVLYLRPFRTDTTTGFRVVWSGSAFTTDEEQLAAVLRPFGDLVAIGRPGEALPMPGAARMYASDSEWQSVVRERMQSAPLVVIRAGAGAGLLWEFGQALSTLDPEKVVIFVFNLTKEEYNAFSAEIERSFQLTLPTLRTFGAISMLFDVRDNPSKVEPGFIIFCDGWRAQFLALPRTTVRLGYNDFKKAFSIALRPVFDRHGVLWKSASRLG